MFFADKDEFVQIRILFVLDTCILEVYESKENIGI